MGIFPVQAVRRATRDEHVDDHQIEIAELVNDHATSASRSRDPISPSDVIELRRCADASSTGCGEPTMIRVATEGLH